MTTYATPALKTASSGAIQPARRSMQVFNMTIAELLETTVVLEDEVGLEVSVSVQHTRAGMDGTGSIRNSVLFPTSLNRLACDDLAERVKGG